MRESIYSRVLEIIDDAIERVSEGVDFFTVRSLFYAVRLIYLTSFPNVKFYKQYNSFTQDFLPKYEKTYGRIEGLVREPRGNIASVDEWAKRESKQIMTGLYLQGVEEGIDYDLVGCGNKIIAVEKAGLWRAMVENRFDLKLDAILMNTGGFSTEAGREVLVEAHQTGLPVCILHDYDINGVLIYTTLTKPTQRRDSYVPNVIDLGLNWEVVSDLIERGDIIPEPVPTLRKQDQAKLEGLVDRGRISYEEYDFLRENRVELNALTPFELMNWLEKVLEEKRLWKTIPNQEELDDHLLDVIDGNFEDLREQIEERIFSQIWRELRLSELGSLLYAFRQLIESELKHKIETRWGEAIYDGYDLNKFVGRLREDMFQFWRRLADKVGGEISSSQMDSVAEQFSQERDEISEEVKDEEVISNYMKDFIEEVNNWISENGNET
jgi:hypothetical protein